MLRRIATICSGQCFLRAIFQLLSYQIFSHYTWYKIRRSRQTKIAGEISPMRTQSGLALTGAISNRSFTGWLRFCLQPRYRSVVCTETWPSRN